MREHQVFAFMQKVRDEKFIPMKHEYENINFIFLITNIHASYQYF